MANNFAEALFGARDNARDRIRQQEMDAQANQMRQFQMQEAQTKSRGSQQEALYGLAKGYKDYLSQNPQGGQQYYERFLAPSLRGLGLGDPGPYNEPEAISLADQVLSAYGGQQTGSSVQSTYVDNEGNRVAVMRDGSRQILGQNAPNNQIIDTGNGFFGVNKGNLSAAPVVVGGGQAAPRQPIPVGGQFMGPDGIPVQMDPSMDPAVQQAIMANPAAWAGAPDGATATLPPQQGVQQLRSAPKEPAVPSGYRQNADGSLSMIPGGPAQVAADARTDAAAARKAAEDVKAQQKAQEANQRKMASDEAASGLISAIDQLTASPGFSDLGTTWGDAQIAAPFVRNDAKDAQAQLKNVAGQVALAALARLKSLSSTGATGFGSLTKPELDLVQNSIATLQSEDISNAELRRSLKIIRDAMEKVSNWQPPANEAPADDDIDSLLDQYR